MIIAAFAVNVNSSNYAILAGMNFQIVVDIDGTRFRVKPKNRVLSADNLDNLEIVTSVLRDEAGLLGSLALVYDYRGE